MHCIDAFAKLSSAAIMQHRMILQHLTILSYVVKKTWLVDIVGSVDQLTLVELLTISSLFIAFIAWLFIAKTDIGIVDICGIIRFVKEMRAKDICGIMHCMDRDNSFR